MAALRYGLSTATALALLTPALLAQGIGFMPVPAALPNGPFLNATPVVSFDGLYVRTSVNVQFIGNAGFNTYNVPGAVSGGPSGPGALGGVGLGMGGAGGPLVGGGGQSLFAGMNGVIDPTTGYGYDPGALPGGNAFPGNPALPGNTPAAWGNRSAEPPLQGPAPRRAGASPRIVKPAPKPRGKANANHPASAGPAVSAQPPGSASAGPR